MISEEGSEKCLLKKKTRVMPDLAWVNTKWIIQKSKIVKCILEIKELNINNPELDRKLEEIKDCLNWVK